MSEEWSCCKYQCEQCTSSARMSLLSIPQLLKVTALVSLMLLETCLSTDNWCQVGTSSSDTFSVDFVKRAEIFAPTSPPPEQRPIRWFHIPKSGTSFANTVFHLACPLPPSAAIPPIHALVPPPDKGILVVYFSKCFPDIVPDKCNFSVKKSWHQFGHRPLSSDERNSLNKMNVVTIVREPAARLVSGYYNNKHDCPQCTVNTTLYEYASMHKHGHKDGPAGCMTKMLLGRSCSSVYPTRSEVIMAMELLRQFTVVGLVDQWERSVCIAFKRLNSGDKTVLPSMFENVRPSSSQKSSDEIVRQLQVYLFKNDLEDWADSFLYKEAVKLFHEALKQTGCDKLV